MTREPELTFYDAQHSPNAYKVRLLLALLARPHRVVWLDVLGGAAKSAEFRRHNPFGRVPFIEEAGFGLAESNAILLYLSRGTPLAPADPRALALVHQWMFFEQNQLELGCGNARYYTRFKPDADKVALWRPRGEAALEALEAHLAGREWLVGDACTAADLALFAYSHVAGEGGVDLQRFPAVLRWHARVRSLPHFLPFAG